MHKDDRLMGSRMQTPVIIGLNSSEEKVTQIINDISKIAKNLLFRKVTYKYYRQIEKAKATLYLSIMHPLSRTNNIESVDYTELP